MRRLIFLLLLVANILPLFLEAPNPNGSPAADGVPDGGTIKQCYVGDEENYKVKECKFFNNDACHTIVCDNKEVRKSCGKCPPPGELDYGCNCEECNGELCNKEDTVDQCYSGDEQKGFGVMNCMAPHNTACKKITCSGGSDYSIDPETGKHGNGFAMEYHTCGKCHFWQNKGGCKCFQCKDKDLCNASLRIELSPFVLMLAMIGGGAVKCYSGPWMDDGGYGECESNKGICYSVECDWGSVHGSFNMDSGCGGCPDSIGRDCKCSNCTGDLCNAGEPLDLKSTIKECYGGGDDNYQPEKCKFFNNDVCHTTECDGRAASKGCGKCRGRSDWAPLPPQCKCEECTGEMCNNKASVMVSKCFVGDQKRGHIEANCGPYNKACHKLDCSLTDRIHKRGCGKCPANEYSKPENGPAGSPYEKCYCFECADGDLCNGSTRNEAKQFLC